MDRTEALSSALVGAQRTKSRLPGDQGIWIFILIDMCFFGILFLSFVIAEWNDFLGFRKSQALLETNFGLFNTSVLLTSSWLVALGMQAARLGESRMAAGLSLGAALLGVAFLVVKALEYTHKFEAGVFLTTNNFFMYYFVITFLHALHVFGGSIVLVIMARRLAKKEVTLADVKWLESAGIFWHTVDFLWVVIFALFYLISWQ